MIGTNVAHYRIVAKLGEGGVKHSMTWLHFARGEFVAALTCIR